MFEYVRIQQQFCAVLIFHFWTFLPFFVFLLIFLPRFLFLGFKVCAYMEIYFWYLKRNLLIVKKIILGSTNRLFLNLTKPTFITRPGWWQWWLFEDRGWDPWSRYKKNKQYPLQGNQTQVTQSSTKCWYHFCSR